MKTTMFVLAALVAGALAGCQEGGPTDPSLTPAGHSEQLPKAPASENHIAIQTMVQDANGQKYELVGYVRYTLTRSPILGREIFDLAFTTEIKVVRTDDDFTWTVVNKSLHTVDLTGPRLGVVQEWHALQAGPGSHFVVIQFEVSSTLVVLKSISVM